MQPNLNRNYDLVSLAINPEARSWGADRLYTPSFVESMIRQALVGWGLGRTFPEAPLADIIPPGSHVLLKPNWVLHKNEGTGGLDCLYTHPVFLLVALKEILAARPAHVTVGDAPIQSCDFDAVVTPELRSQIESLCKKFGVSVEILDFRRTIQTGGVFKSSVATSVREEDRYIFFDLGHDSLLEPLCEHNNNFRVGDYDPRELAHTHFSGKHQYLLCREAFEADVVISLPKLKTHCKAGLTGALKNLVGLNGSKDYLPHYRAGGSQRGGDNYEGGSIVRVLSEVIEDRANRRLNSVDYPFWKNTARGMRFISGGAAKMGGRWHGNDTVWRMVLDLNRILVYGRKDGTLSNTPRRTFYSLTDALMCGQGDGPLRPQPCPVGAVSFGASPVACDLVHAALLRLDAIHIPLLREAGGHFRWPLTIGTSSHQLLVNGKRLSLEEFSKAFGVNAEPPVGWRDRIELSSVRSCADAGGNADKREIKT